MIEGEEHWLEVVAAGHEALDARLNAAQALGASCSAEARQALLSVASDTEAPDVLGSAAGDALARVVVRRGELVTVPLADVSAPAYLAFDAAVTRLLTDSHSSEGGVAS